MSERILALADDYASEVANTPQSPTPVERAIAVTRIERARNALAEAVKRKPMTAEEIARLVNDLTRIAGIYHDSHQLRDRLSYCVVRAVEAYHGIKEQA